MRGEREGVPVGLDVVGRGGRAALGDLVGLVTATGFGLGEGGWGWVVGRGRGGRESRSRAGAVASTSGAGLSAWAKAASRAPDWRAVRSA